MSRLHRGRRILREKLLDYARENGLRPSTIAKAEAKAEAKAAAKAKGHKQPASATKGAKAVKGVKSSGGSGSEAPVILSFALLTRELASSGQLDSLTLYTFRVKGTRCQPQTRILSVPESRRLLSR